eukprot:CCRYP_002277-RA/>CCRYP_002277-RA protein AED:0.35 eAED:0.35 QI:0/0/0/1/0/0/3/0/78
MLDISGTFLYAELVEDGIMFMQGGPKINRPHIIVTSKQKKLLYSAFLFCLQLVKDLQEFSFELNPYDPSVANEMVYNS